MIYTSFYLNIVVLSELVTHSVHPIYRNDGVLGLFCAHCLD